MATLGCGSPIPEPIAEPQRFQLSIPADRVLRSFVMSPDGRRLAYSAESSADERLHLYLGAIEGTAASEIAGSAGAHSPFFSPNGEWVAYFSRGSIWRVRVDASGGQEPQRIAAAPSDSAGGTWTDDGRVVFASLGNHGLMSVPASGGVPSEVTGLSQRDAELEHGWPHALPGGAIVFTVTQRGRDSHLEVLLPSKERRRLTVPAIGQAEFVRSGHLVYSYLGNLLGIAFDVASLRTNGTPVVLAKGVQTQTGFGNLGRSGFSVSRTGTLAMLPSSAEDARSRLVRVDRSGRYSTLAAPPEIYQTPRIAPDGRRLAVVVRPGVMTREIRVLDAARPERVLVTLQGGDNQSPAWMPDSRHLTFGSNRDGLQKIYVVAVSGGDPKPLFSIDASAPRNPASWTRTPPQLALYEIDPVRRRDVVIYRVDESVMPVAATAANERSPVLSPDGRSIAYVSDEPGRDEIFVKHLGDASGALQLTTGGATEPVWTREGLFYREGDRVLQVTWRDGIPGEPREVLEGVFERDPGGNLAAYDVDPRGQFLLMLKSALVPRQVHIVTNWETELARAVRGSR
jgi:Tol biopolymer transport system component